MDWKRWNFQTREMSLDCHRGGPLMEHRELEKVPESESCRPDEKVLTRNVFKIRKTSKTFKANLKWKLSFNLTSGIPSFKLMFTIQFTINYIVFS